MLINPPDEKMIQGAIPKELGSDRMGKYPPLGLLYMASYALAKDPGLCIKIVDAITDDLSHEAIRREIEAFEPDVVGISVYTFTLIDALQVAETAREIAPTAKVILGGFHPSIYPKETLLCSACVDVAIAGEAEHTFWTVIDRLRNKQSLENLPGVSAKRPDGSIFVDRRMPFVKDLDALPFPDRRNVNYAGHTCILGAEGLTTNILSSRGCPFKCGYCYVNVRSYRLRSLPNLMAEIRDCLELGIHDLFLVDDLFNITRQRVIDFSEMIIREGIDVRWSFRGRVDQIDETVLERAKQAGCMRIHYGVESGVPEILERIGKGTNLEMIERTTSLTRQFGIEVSSNLMIGLPGESPKETEQTIRFALNLPTDYIQAAVFTPYPGTRLYREGLDTGVLPNDYWRDFALSPDENFDPCVWGEFYTKEELFDKLREFYRRFYLRPRFVISYLKHLTSMSAFFKMAQNAATLLFLIFKTRSKIKHVSE